MAVKTETENLRELDAWIAEHVMVEESKMVGLKKRGYWYRPNACGYTDRESEAGRYTMEEAKDHEYPRGYEPVTIHQFRTPHYTTDPAAAMQVLEKFCKDKKQSVTIWFSSVHDQWAAADDGCFNTQYAETVSLAIVKLAKALYSK